MPVSPEVRYTYEDYLAIPDDSSHRYEIVEGELFVNPTPLLRHQEVVGNFFRVMSTLAIEHRLGKVYTGPATVRLHQDTVLEPDLLFVSTPRLGILDARKGVLGPPDLVVEVLSPSNRGYDRNLKRKRYLASGVAELWIVDADENTVEVWRPGEEARTISSGSIEWNVGGESFELPLAEIFRA